MADIRNNQFSLESKGFLPHSQETIFSIWFKVVGGRVDAEKLRATADTAKKYGFGYVRITLRQQIKIPSVKLEDAEEASYKLKKQGIFGGSFRKKVRSIVVFHGNNV